MLNYETPKRPAAGEITFKLDGRELTFKPKKKASVIVPILSSETNDQRAFDSAAAMFDWLGSGLTDEDNEYLRDRLLDDDDDFDIEDLTAVASMLFEQASKLPSRPSSD